MRSRLGRTILALAACALLEPAASAQGTTAQVAAPARRAILLRGADAAKGLPFFPPNAIAALSGAYVADRPASPGASSAAASGAPETAVWYSRETLVFSSAWKRVDLGAAGFPDEAAYSLPRGAFTVLALKAAKYTLFFELSDDPGGREFARAFDRKFRSFFDNAAGDAELSFPAFVDY
jgi:hypothetical protein